MVGPQTAEARLALGNQVVAGQPLVVRSVAHGEARLGRDEQPVAAAFHGLPEDVFGAALRVDVGRVHCVDPGIEAEIKLALGTGDIGRARLGEDGLAAEGHGPKGEDGNLEA